MNTELVQVDGDDSGTDVDAFDNLKPFQISVGVAAVVLRGFVEVSPKRYSEEL